MLNCHHATYVTEAEATVTIVADIVQKRAWRRAEQFESCRAARDASTQACYEAGTLRALQQAAV